MRVVIDGVEFAPVSERAGRIGIAVTTHNRPEILQQALSQQLKFLPEGAHLVVVDDGSTVPVTVQDGVKLIRHDKAKGIAGAKNACMVALMDAGCDHLFLFDDDTWPTASGWWKPYVRSPEPHLMHLWGDKFFETPELVAYPWPKGCMLYAERRVVDRVGGLNLAFGRWGCEHMEWSDRIHNAGLTMCRYQDVPGSDALFKALDRGGEVQSSVPLEIRKQANTQAALDGHYADNWLPYRGENQDLRRVALSVLVPSVGARRSTFAPRIADALFGQQEALPAADRQRVEILMLTDAKGMVLGDKRNAMVRLAQGDYIVFVDDDDRLEADYLASLLAATSTGADCITFHAKVVINGAAPKLCRYSLGYPQDQNTATEYHRLPNHITAVRRDIALRCPFPSKLCGEDADYAVRLRPMLKTEHALDRVLYHYDYDEAKTETQQRMPELEVGRAPLVNVVMLSKASKPELQAMAQHAIDTCLATCGKHVVSVLVIEQIPGVRYRDAVTLYEPGEFNYNQFANKGARTGYAPWVMVANSDLEFQPGWLDGLLAAGHPVVSPVDPGHSVQRTLTKNEKGATNGRNLSGWCFMIRRELFDQIGGLDEDFRYWFADDSLIEQVTAAGVEPMVVVSAKVRHLVSQTLRDPSDDLTWALAVKFNSKYGRNKFVNDSRFLAYKKRLAVAA